MGGLSVGYSQILHYLGLRQNEASYLLVLSGCADVDLMRPYHGAGLLIIHIPSCA